MFRAVFIAIGFDKFAALFAFAECIRIVNAERNFRRIGIAFKPRFYIFTELLEHFRVRNAHPVRIARIFKRVVRKPFWIGFKPLFLREYRHADSLLDRRTVVPAEKPPS